MIKSKTLITDFTSGSVTKQLVTFSLPLFLSSLLQVVYNMVDMVIVGQVEGEIGISAVSVGGDVSNFLTFIAIGFSNAGQIIISQYIGAGKKEQIGKFVSTMTSFLMFCAFIISTFCLVFRHQILNLMNTPAESYKQALAYATVCMMGMLFIYGYNIVGAVMRGLGDSKHPFVFISVAAILNIILDIVFVIYFHLGAMGAAIATVISQALSFICCVIFIIKNRERFELEFRLFDFLHIDFSMLVTLLKLGVPMAIKNASVQFSKLFVNSWVNSYGVVVSAMAGIANKIGSICNMFSNSVNTAGSTMVGQNIGAAKYKRVPKIMFTSFVIVFSISTCFTIITVFFPEIVFGVFTKERAVLDIALKFVPIAILLYYGSAFRAAMNALINGSGNYIINFATAILDGFVLRVGLALLFGLVLKMDYMGFWLGDALAGFTPFLIGSVYYLSGKWKTNKYIIKNK